MQIGNSTSVAATANTLQKQSTSNISAKTDNIATVPSLSTGKTTYDFSNMTDQQMIQSKNGLVSSGKLSIQQGLTLGMMIGIPVDSSISQSGGADKNQAVNWYAKIQAAITSAKTTGGEAAKNNVAVLQNIKDTFESLQGSIASFNQEV